MPWFVVSYDIVPDTVHSDDRFEGDALRWGWDKYAQIGETFKRLPRRTLIGEFQNYSAANSNFIEVRNRVAASDHLRLESIILAEIGNFSLLP